jgi:hypothetical protein
MESCDKNDPPVRRSFLAVTLDGVDDYFDFGDVAEFNQLTATAWIKTGTNGKRILSKTQPGIQQYLFKITDSGKLEFDVWTLNGFVICQGTTTVSDNTWHHVAATWDGNSINIYVDGSLDVTLNAVGTLREGTGPLIVGCWEGGSEFFSGSLTEVTLWDKALTEAEIDNLSANCKLLKGDEQNLMLLMAFDKSDLLTQPVSVVNLGGLDVDGTFMGQGAVQKNTEKPCN